MYIKNINSDIRIGQTVVRPSGKRAQESRLRIRGNEDQDLVASEEANSRPLEAERS